MQKLTSYIVSALMFIPFYVFAAPISAPRDFKGFVGIITNIIGTLILLIFALTFLAFMWGVIKSWIIGGGDTESVEKGKSVVLTGIIVLAIMSAIWGILYMLKSSLFGG